MMPARDTGKRPWALPFPAFGQVVLFTTVWATLVTVFGLVAMSPFLLAGLQQSGALVVGPGGSVSGAFGAEDVGSALTASSAVTLTIAAATALATLLAVWVMRRFFGGPALLDLGLRPRPGWLRDVAVGLALGPLMFLVILVLQLAAGWASVGTGTIDAGGLLTAFVTFVLVALSEEVFSRGWVLQVLERGHGARVAAVGSSALFAVLHAFNPGFGLAALVGLFAAGLLFAQAYLVTRQLWLPIALHLSWNFSEGPLFGFPVSGLGGSGLLTVTSGGPEIVTGGGFGPEAGLIVLVGIGLASAAIALLGRRRRPAPPPTATP